jgi:hypothetical protein
MNIRPALTLFLLSPWVASSAVSSTALNTAVPASTSAAPVLHVYGSRGAKQRSGTPGAKLDGTLAELISHLDRVTPQNALADLHSLSPAARFRQHATDPTPLVLVDAVTRGDAQQLRNALAALGLQNASLYSNDVSGWLPVDKIEAATQRAELHSMRAAMSRTRTFPPVISPRA